MNNCFRDFLLGLPSTTTKTSPLGATGFLGFPTCLGIAYSMSSSKILWGGYGMYPGSQANGASQWTLGREIRKIFALSDGEWKPKFQNGMTTFNIFDHVDYGSTGPSP